MPPAEGGGMEISMYDFNKKRNQKVVAIVIIVVIAAMLVTTFVSSLV